MNLLKSEEDRTRLFQAMNQSWTKANPFRSLYRGLVEEYAGSSYGLNADAGGKETMLNLVNQAVDAYTLSLVANRPRAIIDTNRKELKHFAAHFQVAVNNMLQAMDIETVLRKWVVDAFFLVGVVKVHLADAVSVQLFDGKWVDPGTPNVSNVSLDDFVYDMSATRWDQVKYAADGYRIPFDDLDDDRFEKKVVDELMPTVKQNMAGWAERTEMLSKGYQSEADDLVPMIDLMDVWVSREKKIYTFAMAPSSRFYGKGAPLCVMDWDGPELGPYHLMAFNDVPENIMPASPASQICALARLANNLLRKSAAGARRFKEFFTFTPEGAEDAARIKKVSDGEFVKVRDGTEVKAVKTGGVDAATEAFSLRVIDLFDRAAGNLPAMLGLGSQADTLGQENLIMGSVNKKEAQLRAKCIDSTRRLVRNLAWMLWNDSVKRIPGRMQVPGTDATIDATWTPEHRSGDFYDYDLDIDVFSMSYDPPQQKFRAMNELITTIYLPASQQLSAQGGSINWQAYTETAAELLRLPRLRDIIQFAVPSVMQEQSGVGEQGPQPPQTTRNYVRRNVAGGASQAKPSDAAAMMAAASRQNPDQAVSMATSA